MIVVKSEFDVVRWAIVVEYRTNSRLKLLCQHLGIRETFMPRSNNIDKKLNSDLLIGFPRGEHDG